MKKLIYLAFCFLVSVNVYAQISPYQFAPACQTHDNNAWHGLWNPSLGCHYDHHHGDDPHSLDSILGTSYFSNALGEISYPWQTFSTSGTENQLKHKGYFWIVRKNLNYPPPSGAGLIKDFRAQVHQLPDGHDAIVRYHSFALEARVYSPSTGYGFIQIGGWQDSGNLEVDGQVVVSVPNHGNRLKQHSATNPGAVWYPSSQVTEGGRQGFVRVSLTIHDMWDHTTATDPGKFDDYICYPNPRCRMNGTLLRPHLIVVDVPAQFEAIVDPDGDKIANYTGYLNRYGAITQGCTSTGLDCVPFSLSNVRTDISYTYENIDTGRDYDIYFNNIPSGWMQPTH